MPSYLMESEDEAARLEHKTNEDESRAHLRMVGLEAGMSALDAGAGTGAVARVMAALVGPSGRVAALDQSTPRLEQGTALAEGIRNLEFVHGDIYNPPFDGGSFDFVFSRFVFEYLQNPQVALERLHLLVKPGGKLVVGDLDGQGLRHFPIAPELEAKLALVRKALTPHLDPLVGRKLFHMFRMAGLKDIRVHVLPYAVFAGTAPDSAVENWRQKFSTTRKVLEGVLGGGAEYDTFASEFLGLLRSPDTFSYCTLLYVEGVRGS